MSLLVSLKKVVSLVKSWFLNPNKDYNFRRYKIENSFHSKLGCEIEKKF